MARASGQFLAGRVFEIKDHSRVVPVLFADLDAFIAHAHREFERLYVLGSGMLW